MNKEVEYTLEAFKKGLIALYPTDTIWGLGCLASDLNAINRIYELKQRPASKSVIILANGLPMAENWTLPIPEKLKSQISNSTTPTTIIVKANTSCPKHLISDKGEIALRIVRDPFCESLISRLNQPIVSTSANLSGQPAPALFSEIDKRILNKVDYVVNWRQDDRKSAVPSRIVRFESGEIIQIR